MAALWGLYGLALRLIHVDSDLRLYGNEPSVGLDALQLWQSVS